MKLKEIRTNWGLTQKMLAERLDVNQQTIARWENGKTEPSLAQLRDLAMVFETSVDAILGKEKPVSLTPRYHPKSEDDMNKDYFYGYLGITLYEGKLTKWYPVTEKVAVEFMNLDFFTEKDRGGMIFETLNNRYVWVNLENVTFVTINDDDADEPEGDWKLTYKEDFFNEEFYRLMDNYPESLNVDVSDNLRRGINNYISKNNLDDGGISKLMNYSYFYGKEKMFFDGGLFVDKELYPTIFTSLDDFEYTKYLRVKDFNAEYIFNTSKLAMVDAPRLAVLKAFDKSFKEN